MCQTQSSTPWPKSYLESLVMSSNKNTKVRRKPSAPSLRQLYGCNNVIEDVKLRYMLHCTDIMGAACGDHVHEPARMCPWAARCIVRSGSSTDKTVTEPPAFCPRVRGDNDITTVWRGSLHQLSLHSLLQLLGGQTSSPNSLVKLFREIMNCFQRI